MKLYKIFKCVKQPLTETEFVEVSRLIYNGKETKVIQTKRRATRFSVIHCFDDCVAWEQLPMFPRLAGRSFGDKKPIYKFEKNKNVVTIFVVRGKPHSITGLDEGIFRCADNFDEDCLNVMSEARFKTL